MEHNRSAFENRDLELDRIHAVAAAKGGFARDGKKKGWLRS
jgi:hypothetical protein